MLAVAYNAHCKMAFSINSLNLQNVAINSSCVFHVFKVHVQR